MAHHTLSRHHPRMRVIQYSRDASVEPISRGVLDPRMRGDDNLLWSNIMRECEPMPHCAPYPSRHCEEPLRRSNPFFLLLHDGLLRGSLSSGAHSRDPLARNDAVRFLG